MFKLGGYRALNTCALVLVAMVASSSLSAQTVPVVAGIVPSSSELLDIGLVVGGDMLSGSLLDDTLSLPGAGVVLGGSLLETVGSLSLPTSLPVNTGVLELVGLPAQAL
jgi:hypothetical protein